MMTLPPPTSAAFVLVSTGETVELTAVGRTLNARVVIASGNGRSVFLEFDAMIDGHAGGMPLMWSDDADGFCSIANGRAVKLARKSPQAIASGDAGQIPQ